MDKRLVMAGLAGCIVAAAMAVGKTKSAQPRPEMWDKMRERMAEMPEDFPPRVMYDNVEATRANTEKILELLQGGEV